MSIAGSTPAIGNVKNSLLHREEFPKTGERKLISKLGICLTYLWRHRRIPNLAEPKLFTEFVQHRKLYDRNRMMPLMADKVIVKAFVADMLGSEWVVPSLWSGTALLSTPQWPTPFVVKSRHGCNQIVFVRYGDENWSKVRARARGWMKSTYGRWLGEWLLSSHRKRRAC